MAQNDTAPHEELRGQGEVLGKDSLVSFPGGPGAPCSAVGGHWADVDLCEQVVASEVLCITGTT